MTVFFYQATDRSGKLIEGDIEAEDHRLAVQKIRGLNYFPIQIWREKPKRSSLSFKLPSLKFLPPISQKELMNITQQLATLINSGLTLDKSLSTLALLAEREKSREILSDIQNRVHGGSAFSAALSEYPRVFSKLYTNMVRTGEAGGALGSILIRLTDFMEKSQELKANIRSALIYPVLLVLVGGAAVTVLMTVVIPKFSAIFGDMGKTLPLSTTLLLWTSAFLGNYWWALLLSLAAAACGFLLYLKTETGKFRWDRFLLKLPLFGPLIQKIQVSRFSRTMSTLLTSGVPVLQALSITRTILSNSVITRAMDQIHDALKGGKGLAEPLRRLGVFPPLAVHMITVGEETGAMEEMLEKISVAYDKEVERSIKQLISLIEPLMILLMGGIVGFIVISMLMAIFSINEVPL
ncbi:MAG: type II secretion system inner membrane protein GspF [Nitrospinae bacterium]|nr:type II secretion system inner membrane protein GspF [Nitrospinota bacterium]